MFQRILPSCLFAMLALPFLAAADQPKSRGSETSKDKSTRAAAALQELLRFQGTWVVESQEINGKPAPASDIKGRTIFFGGELFILRKGDEILQIGIQKLDASKSPHTTNAMISKGLYQGETMLGIYSFEGNNRLKVCFEIEGQNRPTEFKTAEGEGRFVTTYRRLPPPADETDSIVGKYDSIAVDLEGKEHKSDAQITRQGDAYLVRYTHDKALVYLGIGIRRGNMLSVAWSNGGETGLSLYRIEKDGRLLGDYTQLGAIGIVNKENLIPKKPQATTRIEKTEKPEAD